MDHAFVRLVLGFYVVIIVMIVLVTLSKFAMLQIEIESHCRKLDLLARNLDYDLITELDTDGDGVDKFEFISGIMIQTG
jgi:hypothetical protein